MTSYIRQDVLIQDVEYIIKNNIPGDFIEIGVWKGGIVMMMLLKLKELGVTNRHIHLYDTFTGMTDPSEHDIYMENKQSPQTHPEFFAQIDCTCGLEEVIRNIESVGYPMEYIHFHKGDIRETDIALIPKEIALLRLDNDWYDLYKFELLHFEPNVVNNGIVIIDDYHHWGGCKKAVDEYIQNRNVKLIIHGDSTQWITHRTPARNGNILL